MKKSKNEKRPVERRPRALKVKTRLRAGTDGMTEDPGPF